MNVTNEFIPPPEAPVFEPTSDEFEDPIAYIDKIRPTAEKYGLCKIRPPSDWQPPFAVDVDMFRFTPRVQRLNELEAKTRIKLNFLDRLAKFWELQHKPLRIPAVEKSSLDLYLLYKVVQNYDGFHKITKNNKWYKVASQLGYPNGVAVGPSLQQHYERILLPFEIFMASTSEKQSSPEGFKIKREDFKSDRCKFSAVPCRDKMSTTPKADPEDVPKVNINFNMNNELKKLQFFGAGPKTALPDANLICLESDSMKRTRPKSKDGKILHSMEGVLCATCGLGEGTSETMVICDICDYAFHTACVLLPINENMRGWRCPDCIAKECKKPMEVYGFDQAKCEYTLQSFGEMADKFKHEYFKRPIHTVPCSTVEAEFWRLVNCIEEDVIVEYGADIHTTECGSGFPVEKNKHLFPDDHRYVTCGWNLNNLANLPRCVLRHINVNISGMKIPWCYVGMCFSSFAWHIEDHWSYSINYLHWGEPKTWYGVPGSKAELLEDCMKHNAPELFEQSPDLLHQLTTIMNPNTLMDSGVPICRTDQHAGEFVITFPRAYHAGFNQGYNFAEAVNFCTADWLPMGRQCIEHYRSLKRYCVFSHDELVCKMAFETNTMDESTAMMVYKNLLAIIEDEKNLRKKIRDQGTTSAEKVAFELWEDDDARQCFYCKTTCFLSALKCSCSEQRLVCLHHYDKLCSCPATEHCLQYRNTLDELLGYLSRLEELLHDFNEWTLHVKSAFEAIKDKKLDFWDMKALLTEAEENAYPTCPLLEQLSKIVTEAEKCFAVANHLVGGKSQRKKQKSGDNQPGSKMSYSELENFIEEMESLPCKIDATAKVQELLNRIILFQTQVKVEMLKDPLCLDELERLMEKGNEFEIELPEINLISQEFSKLKWIEKVKADGPDMTKSSFDTLQSLIGEGAKFPSCKLVNVYMDKLKAAAQTFDEFERKALQHLNSKRKPDMHVIEQFLDEMKVLSVSSPSISKLEDAIKNAKDWISEYETLRKDSILYMDPYDSLVRQGLKIPIHLPPLPELEAKISLARTWLQRVSKVFVPAGSVYTLLQVLKPRTDLVDLINESESDDVRVMIDKDVEEECSAENEILNVFKLRLANEMKQTSGTNAESVHCMCLRGRSGPMVQCQLCKEIFHETCVNFSRNTSEETRPVRDIFYFLCPRCIRSKRPVLADLPALLQSLKNVPFRLHEGDALQVLVTRAVNWQDKVMKALNRCDVAGVRTICRQDSFCLEKFANLECSLKPESIQCLERLCLEGGLLEVTLVEKKLIQSVLCTYLADYAGVCLDFPISPSHNSQELRADYAKEWHSHSGSMVRCFTKNLRPKRSLESDTESGTVLANNHETTKNNKLRNLKRKYGRNENLTHNKPDLGHTDQSTLRLTGHEITTNSQGYKIRNSKQKHGKVENQASRQTDLGSAAKTAKNYHKSTAKDNDKASKCQKGRKMKRKLSFGGSEIPEKNTQDEKDENCSAKICQMPTDDEVEWVQCDQCELWFHFLCIGMKKCDIPEDVDYVCEVCRNLNTSLPVIHDTFTISGPLNSSATKFRLVSTSAMSSSNAALCDVIDIDSDESDDESRYEDENEFDLGSEDDYVEFTLHHGPGNGLIVGAPVDASSDIIILE